MSMRLEGRDGAHFEVRNSGGIAGHKFLSVREAQNLELLWNRERGSLFYNDNGYLRVMNVVERFFFVIFCYFSKEYQREVGEGVNHLIADLTNHFNDPNLLEGGNEQEHYTAFIETLFFDKLAPLSHTVYKRDLSEKQYTILKGRVQAPADFSPDAKEAFRERQTEAFFWAKMGSFIKREGSSVSYQIIKGRILYREGVVRPAESLGLFKPKDREPFSPENPKTLQKVKMFLLDNIFPCLWGSLREINGGSGYIAEEASYKLSFHFRDALDAYFRDGKDELGRLNPHHYVLGHVRGQPLVPETHVARFEIPREGMQEGSFQRWIDQPFEELHTTLDLNRHYKRRHWCQSYPTTDQLKERFPQEFFELMFIFDFIVANSDRHGENCFVHKDNQEGRTTVTGMRLIDAGRSFPPRAPRPWNLIETRSLYQWERLPVTQEGFSDFGKFMINYLNQRRDAIVEDLRAVYTRHEKDGDLTRGRMAGVRERLAVLSSMKDQNIREVTSLKTQEHFAKFWADNAELPVAAGADEKGLGFV